MTESRSARGGRDGLLIAIGLVVTFSIVRLWLHNSPNTDVFVAGYNIHHLFTGLLLLAATMLPLIVLRPSGHMGDLLALVVGVGLALAMDEWVYLIATDGSNDSYLLPVSFWGGVTMITICAGYAALLIVLARRRSGRHPDRPNAKDRVID